MTEFAGIFEVLAADQSDARLASRRALVLARDRIDARLGKFLGASRSPAEFAARYDLVSEDFTGIVRVAADEVGHDNPDALAETLRAHYADKEHWIQDAVKKPGDLHKKLDVPEDEKIPEDKIEHAEETGDKNLKEKAQFAENVKKGAADNKGDCSECGKDGFLKGGVCGPCRGKKLKGDGDNDKENHDQDEDADDGDDSLSFAARTAAPAGNTGLAGPSPTMDKKRWTPQSVKPIDVPSERHPTVQKDITEAMPRENEGPPGDIGNIDEINALTTTESLPTATGMDDSGFNADKNTGDSGATKTWGTDSREADPVGSASLEA